jgi:apolipoprotein N-acyltransferase
VEGRTGLTPYARWVAYFGLWPLAIFALALVLVALGRRRAAKS